MYFITNIGYTCLLMCPSKTSLQFTRERKREENLFVNCYRQHPIRSTNINFCPALFYSYLCQLFEMLELAEFLLTADQRLSNCFSVGTNHIFEKEKGGFHSRVHLHLPPNCFPKKYPAQFPPLKKVSRAGEIVRRCI